MRPPSILIILGISCYDMFICTSCSSWCVVLIFFIWDCCQKKKLHVLAIYSGVFSFHLVTPTHRPIHTHPLCKGFADAHRFTLKCWWVVGGVDWTIFRDSPYKSDFISVTHVRAMICCLLILFITQSGRYTLRPASLLLCCFPLHGRQISSDITSPLSSTATKNHKLPKD